MRKIIAMGLDGSIQNFGIAVCEIDLDSKTILRVEHLLLSKTKKDGKAKRAEDDFKRFATHYYQIRGMIWDYGVEYIFGEIPAGAKDARAAFAFGGVTAILGVLSYDKHVTTVTPREVKIAATGLPHADKDDIIAAMYDAFPDANWILSKRSNAMDIQTLEGEYLTNDNEHLADALGIILAGMTKL